MGAPWVVAAYYLVGLPLSAGLGFGAGWGVQGMVGGMLVGKLFHAAAFSALVWSTPWDAEVRRAAQRVAAERMGGTERATSNDTAAAAAELDAPLPSDAPVAAEHGASPTPAAEIGDGGASTAHDSSNLERGAVSTGARVPPKGANAYAQLHDEA